MTILVIGATGEIGKHVVQMLSSRQQHHHVKVLVRSKERMLNLLPLRENKSLEIIQGDVLDLSDSHLEHLVKGCRAVINCLSDDTYPPSLVPRMFQRRNKRDKQLVYNTTKRLYTIMESCNPTAKYILLGSNVVVHVAKDNRTLSDYITLLLIRHFIPTPHKDNQKSACYLLQKQKANQVDDEDEQPKLQEESIEWSIIRSPINLTDGHVSVYHVLDQSSGSFLFGNDTSTATRQNVAHFITTLTLDDTRWKKYKYHMPVIQDKVFD